MGLERYNGNYKKYMETKDNQEIFSVSGTQVLAKVKEIIKDGKKMLDKGNSYRIIIKNAKGEVLVEIPAPAAAVGTACAPILAGVGAMAALLTKCTIIVEKKTVHEKK